MRGGAENFGGAAERAMRMGVAIDAALNIQKRYRIDPKRVYAAGVSGGGRVASMLGVSYADVKRGGVHLRCDR